MYISKNIKIYRNIILSVVFMVRNLVGRIQKWTQTEGVWEQGAEENIWV